MQRPDRLDMIADLRILLGGTTQGINNEQDWADIVRRVRQGTLIPIVADRVRGERIFQAARPLLGARPDQSVDEMLAGALALSIDYPFADGNELARVTQYHFASVSESDEEEAKASYLRFLVDLLLATVTHTDPELTEVIQALHAQLQMGEVCFSDVVQELAYPPYESPDEDSLRLLARLPLPIYLTTSPYDFLEQALRAEGRPNLCVQICFWNGEPLTIAPLHKIDPGYRPSPETPVVYHLFGHERYPSSLILSEDDYLEFLVKVTQPVDSNQPIVPLYLRSALARSSLLLLGYRLRDWDFRVLFRGLIHEPERRRINAGMAIQLDPTAQAGITNPEQARLYLKKYFQEANFRVIWDDADSFMVKLWQSYRRQ